MDLLINIDVPDLDAAIVFYVAAFGLKVTRRLGLSVVELDGWPARLYLLEKAAGSVGAGQDRRRYDRHWTPVHFDVVVHDLDAACDRAVRAGARAETESRNEVWGRIAQLADPFGNGFCMIQFVGRGYEELVRADIA
jgi:predicted enzyme related to lactoylglutathione lyase